MKQPRYKYDCGNCKFNWCCGYTCACILKDLPDPPDWLQKNLKTIHDLLIKYSELKYNINETINK